MFRPDQANNIYHYQRKQHGAALMVMLVIMIMGSAAFLVSSLSSSVHSNARQETTSAALAQAKEALIGYAVKDGNRPGELPCPDIDNDGQLTVNVDYIGSQCANLLGRLPWKTLGLPDLRDAAGERLWYALSDPFHANSTAVLNSDTAGTLSVDGNIIANNVIAIVFAPGQNLPGQDRSAANINTPSAFLESIVSAPTSFRLLIPDDRPSGNYTYNDQLTLITHDNLFQATEKVVGRRVRDLLNASHTVLGRFPFAAPFTDPSVSTFIATTGTYSGLWPNATAIWAATPTYSLNGGSADVSCELRTGNNSLANARARCSISNISGSPTITISGILNYLGLWSEYDLANVNEVRVRIRGPSCTTPDPGWGSTLSCAAAAVPGLNAAIVYTVNADRSVTVTFTGLLFPGVERVEMRDMVLDSRYDWIMQNQWNRVMYYAVSPGHAPDGGNTCNPLPGTPSCLTVNGGSGGNNKHAVVVMTSGALSGTHPSGNLADYLEGENATPADFIYENKTRSSTFNDQVIVAAP